MQKLVRGCMLQNGIFQKWLQQYFPSCKLLKDFPMSLQEVHTVCGLEALVPVMMRRQERKDVTYEAKPCKLH